MTDTATLNGRKAPHNEQAESSLLGACLLSRTALATALDVVAPDDFTGHRGDVFDALSALWLRGDPSDPVAVGEELTRRHLLDACGGVVALEGYTKGTPATAAARHYAEIVAEHSGLRKVIGTCGEIAQRAYDLAPLGDVLDDASQRFARVQVPSVEPSGVFTSGELAQRQSEPQPWVIDGLLRRQWRAVVVSTEGAGKSILLASMALGLAEGLNPLNQRPITPAETLIVDLENPEDVLVERMRATVPATCWVWHQPGGINLRERRDRGQLESLIERRRPALVCLGPLYKAYRSSGRESSEQVAREVTQVLDDLRTRYGFALLMEQHAPHGESRAHRDLRPIDSSLWLRWPEFGLSLVASKEVRGSLDVKRFRADRVRASWPQRLDRDGKGGWVGRWEERTL